MANSYQPLTGPTINAVKFTLMTQDASAAGNASSLTPDTTLGTSGVFTLVDGPNLIGYVEDVDFEQEYEDEEVGMLGCAHASTVSGLKRTTITFTEVLKYRNGCFLQTAFNNVLAHSDGDQPGARIARVTIQRAGTGFNFYVKFRSYREMYRKGKNVGVLVCTVHDPGDTDASGAYNSYNPAGVTSLTSGTTGPDTYTRTNGI